MTTLHLKKSIGGSPSRLALLLIPLVFACFGLSPTARALLPPPAPDGGYLNGNTAEGSAALYHLTTGFGNTAIGLSTLYNNTTGSSNTAVGADALSENDTGVARLSSASTSLRTSAPLRTQRHLNTLGNGHPTLFRDENHNRIYFNFSRNLPWHIRCRPSESAHISSVHDSEQPRKGSEHNGSLNHCRCALANPPPNRCSRGESELRQCIRHVRAI